jgi:hypothetical protein
LQLVQFAYPAYAASAHQRFGSATVALAMLLLNYRAISGKTLTILNE